MAKAMSSIFAVLMLLAELSLQQKNPLNDFCRRFGHQTAVVDQKLYIDGGLLDWNPISQNDQNYTNTWLLYNDLTTSPAGIGVPQLYANLSKNSSIPDVSGGILWADDVNKRFYLYGGDYSGISPNSPDLLSYDILYNQWEYFGAPNMPIQSVSWGGGVGISDLGQGYVLGGWLSNNSVPDWSGASFATSTLIKYDMNEGAWTNNTGPDSTPRAEGVMVYIPASYSGLLVYFGGVTVENSNGTMLPAPMSTIHVYDIQSSKWYTQTAVGDVPLARRRFCAGAAWAPDYSSYNIYLYGGLGFGANYSGFDDVYILSLPSFTWIKWWEGSGVGNPHNSLTCNVVNSGQMLIIGGTFPLTENCDSPPTWGTHNLDLGKQSGKMWNDYQINITSYVVPSEVISVVGGSSLGGATATAPAAGFDNSDLSVYFTQRATVASRTPTRAIPTSTGSSTNSPSSKRLSTGAIAGIAVAGAVVLLALLLGAFCCIRRHRRNHLKPPPAQYHPSPIYTQVPITPQSPPPQVGQRPQSHLYQLPAAVPVELSASNYHQEGGKDSMYHHVQDTPQYTEWQGQPPEHHASPIISPHPSVTSGRTDLSWTGTNISPFGTQTSPAPTYSSIGRPSRKPVPQNQTYYSP